MANALEPYYLLQSAFTGGEISPEVAHRSDLDKYQFALLKARNVLVRPYGPVYKRYGFKYCVNTKYADKQCMLKEFSFTPEINYLLEIGEGYIRVHRDGEYLGVELETPYTESDLPNLRFAQSADVLFIASGSYPVKQVARYSETDWRITDFEIEYMYFDESQTINNIPSAEYYSPGTYTFTAPADGDYTFEVAAGGGGGGGVTAVGTSATAGAGGRGGYASETVTLEKGDTLTIVIGAGGEGASSSYAELESEDDEATVSYTSGTSGGDSSIGDTVASGGTGGGESDGTSYGNGGTGGAGGSASSDSVTDGSSGSSGWAVITSAETVEITPSDTTGGITLTASQSIFTEEDVGSYMQITHAIDSETVTVKNTTTKGTYYYSDEVLVGESWQIISHGTWTGTLCVEYKNRNDEWKEYRKYTSSNDYNPSESGTVDEPVYMRVWVSCTSGTCTADFTRLPYDHVGSVKITDYISETEVSALVIVDIGSTDATDELCWGAWSESRGYPKTVCFFQDRLCFGGNDTQPYVLWMSQSGDYGNFSVEEADGSVTDDSAIAAAFVSRKQFDIKHLIVGTDLFVLSSGNEWVIRGDEVVTPSNITPVIQQTYGVNDCEPEMVGGRLIYVQQRGSTVRDMAYSYATDSYGGSELTLFVKHFIRGKQIVSMTYQQNPDSHFFFVFSDGTMGALTYIQEQNVYAWSLISTEGAIEAVEDVGEGNEDILYIVVAREINGETVRYIERMPEFVESEDPMDYIMVDSAVAFESEDGASSFTAGNLAGQYLSVLADGYAFNVTADESGTFTLPGEFTKVIAGLPFTMQLESTNAEIRNNDGSILGRKKYVSNVKLSLYYTLGGKIGSTFYLMDKIPYDEFYSSDSITLFNDTKDMVMPLGGFDTTGKVCIESDEPYPFNLCSLVREVSFGG